MAMHNPPHPGRIVRRQCLEPLGLSVTEAARGLGVTRQALSELVNERAGISVEMAIRLAKAFGSSPETWLGMQMAYDLWQARDRGRAIEVRRFHAAGWVTVLCQDSLRACDRPAARSAPRPNATPDIHPTLLSEKCLSWRALHWWRPTAAGAWRSAH
jgi:addiction module HigA family antidote